MSLKTETLEWVRIFRKTVQKKKKGSMDKHFGLYPTAREQTECFKNLKAKGHAKAI